MNLLNRRDFFYLLGGAAAAGVSMPAFAAGIEDRKFVFVVLRGGLDGLATLVPTDPALETLRPTLYNVAADGLSVNSDFRLHPALTHLGHLYKSGDAAFVHAASTAYRARSHFDGQDLLETLSQPGDRIGWMNRLVGATSSSGLGVGYALPLALKGPAETTNWAPAAFKPVSGDLLDRLSRLYSADTDMQTALNMARQTPMMERELNASTQRNDAALAEQAFRAMGKLMSEPNGPGIGMISLDGWDTHANQAGALNRRLQLLDASLAALQAELGTAWGQTCIVLCSEFGRTAAENGTRGTDHGTGGLMILAGGAVKGGRVFGAWPGVRRSDLREARDLAPVNAVENVLAGLLRDHLGADPKEIIATGTRPFEGLIQA